MVDAWAAALDGGPHAVRAILLDPTDDGHDLRQMSPLAGLITDKERLAALAAVDAIVEYNASREPDAAPTCGPGRSRVTVWPTSW